MSTQRSCRKSKRLTCELLCWLFFLCGGPLLALPGSARSGTPPVPPSFRTPDPLPEALAGRWEVVPKDALTQVPLLAGWNLVSLPEEPPATDPATVLAAAGGAYNAVYAYAACDPTDPWKLYDPNDPAASDLTAIDHRIGFWIDATVPVDLPSDGTLPATTTLPLCTGWNLIGFPSGQPRHVRSALASIEGKYVRVFGFDASDPEDPWEFYDVAAPEWANDLQFMVPGRGYWVLAIANATLEIANSDAPPVVEITSPTDLDVVTTFTDVVGTVRSRILESWTLSYRQVGDGGWTPFGGGNFPIENAPLATFDPTVLTNGLYEIALQATDLAGRTVALTLDVVVDGGLKIGHFTLPLLDMKVPVVGVPIEVIRTYDTRDKKKRDFGVGWSLGVSNFQVRENIPPGLGWYGTVTPGFFNTYCIQAAEGHIVTVIFPDGDVARFQPRVEPECQIITPQQEVELVYEPLGGAVSRLEPVDESAQYLMVEGTFPGPLNLWSWDVIDVHDPQTYRLTAADGTAYVVDELDGLRSITDPNGNVLTFSSNGIQHSRGIGLTFVRDTQGRIVEIVDPVANSMYYEYDGHGDLVRVTDREGQSTTFVYVGDHYLDKIITPDGVEIAAFEYDGENRWTGTCDASNHCTRLTHDFEGNREILTDATGRSVSYIYDSSGRVTEVIDGLGNITRYEYGDLDNVTKIIAADDAVTEFVYDSRGNLLSRIDPHPADAPVEHFTTSYTHDQADRLTRVDHPTGAAMVMTYDGAGNLLRQEDEAGNLLIAYTYGSGGVVESETTAFGTVVYSGHDAFGNPLAETDPLGVTTTYTYDELGNVSTISDPLNVMASEYDKLGRKTRYTFDNGIEMSSQYGLGDFPTVMEGPTFGRQERLLTATGRLRGWNMPGNLVTTFDHDESGRLVQQTNPMGSSYRFTYDAAGRLSSRSDPEGAQVTLERDAVGRVVKEIDPLGNETRFGYDDAARLASVIDARGNTTAIDYGLNETMVTDPLGRTTTIRTTPHGLPRETIWPDGAKVSSTYLLTSTLDDADEYPTSITDEGGRTRSFTYDEHGRLAGSTDLAGELYTYSYDNLESNLLSMTGPTGLSRSFTYDTAGRVSTVTYPDGGVTAFSYGPRFTLDTQTLPSGTTIEFAYDEAFRLTGRTTSTGESIAWRWNADDTLAESTAANGTTTYAYDEAGALIGIDYPNGATMRYARDLLGRVVSITTRISSSSPAQTTEYAYDSVGNLISVVDPLGGTTRMDYDAANRLVARTLPNGVTSNFSYNDRDQLVVVEHRNAAGEILSSVAYERQGTGEPTRITHEDGSYELLEYDSGLRLSSEAYYDSAGQLLETMTYTYDAAGNRQSVTDATGTHTYTYGQGHWVTGVTGPDGNESYTYDADGRVVAMNRSGAAFNFSYSTTDQLLSVGTTAGHELVRYGYDADGRRIAVEDHLGSRSVLVARACDDGLDYPHLIADQAGSLLAGFVFAGDQPLLRNGPDGPLYYLTDAGGSVIGLADASGAAAASFRYDSFGNLRSASGPESESDPALGGDFRFHGGWLDSHTGLYYFRARYYDPALGRFLSRDAIAPSILLPETLNGYTFALSNPLLFKDPSGHFTIISLNINMSLRSIVSSIRTSAIRYGKEVVKEQVQEMFKDILLNFLKSILPFNVNQLTASWQPAWREGQIFEEKASELMCKFLGGLGGSVSDALWFEVPVRQSTGKALGPGKFRCDGWRRVRNPAQIGVVWGTPGISWPDFIISTVAPHTVKRNRTNKTFVIGDFKRSAANAIKRNQLRAMVHHAQHYGYRTVLYVTINGLSSRTAGKWFRAQRFAARKGVHVFILSLI